MEHSQELAQQIRARIVELEADIEAHQRALAALDKPQGRAQPKANGKQRLRAQMPQVVDSPATEADGSASKPSSARSMQRRRPVVSTEAVFDALEGNDQAAVIAQEFGVSTSVVRQRLDQLEQAGRVSRSGERRGTRWRSGAAN